MTSVGGSVAAGMAGSVAGGAAGTGIAGRVAEGVVEKNARPAQALVFVTGVSKVDVLTRCLLQSPCVQPGGRPLIAHFNAASAADAFNAAMDSLPGDRSTTWLVWVHQDVMLPAGWDLKFLEGLREAQQRMPHLAVAGVYGIVKAGDHRRAGHVLDRGTLLQEPAPLPCEVSSLDELLFAVRADCGLRLEPALAFDFYATDLVLQAEQQGLQAAVVDAYCEHWSDTPSGTPIPHRMAERIVRSGQAFEAKWAHRFPIETSWLTLNAVGDVERFISGLREKP